MRNFKQAALAVAATGLVLTGVQAPSFAAAPTEITVWAMCNETGEIAAAKEQTAAFNEVNSDKYHATLTCKANMGDTLKATAASSLPSVFEFDGETLGSMVFAGKLGKLNGLVDPKVLGNELVSIQAEGKYSDGNTYSVSQYDSGLALYGNRKMLAAAKVSYPTTWNKAWTAAQFTKVLATLAAKAPGRKAIDFKENYGIGGGWAGYAFTDVVNSAGSQLVDYRTHKATGNMNSAKAIAAVKTWATWKQYSDPSADDKAFSSKRVALAWVGHWAYPAYKAALGKDLVVIPLPDFGMGTKSGQGSHSWGMSSKISGAEQAGAAAYLNYIEQDKWINNVTDQNGAVPATKTSLVRNVNYQKGGDLYLYGQQLAASCGIGALTRKCVTVPRTISPAWPVIGSQFSKAMGAIWAGGDAKTELTKAAAAIDQDAADNGYYN